MEISALKHEDYEVWMEFMDAEVLVRYVQPAELRGLVRKAARPQAEGAVRTASGTDADQAALRLGRAAVRGWCGLTMHGEEYPYSDSNRDFLMSRWGEFARFVGRACIDLQAMVSEEARARGKNSSLTSGQGSTTLA